MRQLVIAVLTAFFGVSAVLLGALGAHALTQTLDEQALAVWHTAVRFQFWHVLALAVLATGVPRGRARALAAWAFVAGIVLFCGSLYALALGAAAFVGFVTPVGGLAFMLGWVATGVTAVAGCRRHRDPA